MHQLHRDLKPDNILVNRLGEIKLSDFGVSKALDSTYMQCHTYVGTAIYMSPERVQAVSYAYPSDVWSLGIILYELATGRLPVSPKTTPLQLYDIIVNRPEPTLNTGQGWSPQLCDITACWYLNVSNLF